MRFAHDRQRRFRSLSGAPNCHSQLRRWSTAVAASLFLETQRSQRGTALFGSFPRALLDRLREFRPSTLSFLIDIMGEEHMVFGSDYCGGLGPLKKSLASVEKQTNPEHVKRFTE